MVHAQHEGWSEVAAVPVKHGIWCTAHTSLAALNVSGASFVDRGEIYLHGWSIDRG